MIKATLMDHMGSDVTVVNAARVSFGKKSDNTYTTDKDEKLIWYLAEHRHMSPSVIALPASMSRHLSLWHVNL